MTLRMRVPVADVVQPLFEQLLDLPALSQPIWHKGSGTTTIRRSRTCGPFNPNDTFLNMREQLAASFTAVLPALAVVHQMRDY